MSRMTHDESIGLITLLWIPGNHVFPYVSQCKALMAPEMQICDVSFVISIR